MRREIGILEKDSLFLGPEIHAYLRDIADPVLDFCNKVNFTIQCFPWIFNFPSACKIYFYTLLQSIKHAIELCLKKNNVHNLVKNTLLLSNCKPSSEPSAYDNLFAGKESCLNVYGFDGSGWWLLEVRWLWQFLKLGKSEVWASVDFLSLMISLQHAKLFDSILPSVECLSTEGFSQSLPLLYN